MTDEAPGRPETLRIWLRIGLAAVVVVGLVLISDPWGEPEDGLVGRNSFDRGAAAVGDERCSPKKAGRVARIWLRGMSSGDAERIKTVTSRGEPVPRYVISVEQGGKSRTVRVGNRASAARTVPKLAGTSDAGRSFEVAGVGRPPKAEGNSELSGRLAGVRFSAGAGDSKWSGRVGVRCGNEEAYYAKFRISDRP